ncbi:MAG: DUF554 domain-containing protein [Eubacterium sp.]|nr:DUF554 domain-containing protein [Eubacterium sp.]
MPIGIIVNIICVVLGGITGSLIGHKLSDSFKDGLNTVFGVCAMSIGISSIILMANMPAVIFSVIAGTAIGLAVHLGDKINKAGELMFRLVGKFMQEGRGDQDADRRSLLVTTIVLFCCSGTGIYGCIVSGMTGDHSILLAKSVLDFPTALIFACTLGAVVSVIAVPQLVIFLLLFFFARMIYPLCSPEMINDFKSCCGILLLATGFRIARIKNFPIADMIPSMVIVLPVSYLWAAYILPQVS